MSDVMEKTLSALPSLLSLDPGSKLSSSSGLGALIRGVTELVSKQDEEKLIKKELAALKEQVSTPTTSLKQMRECLVRLIYCEMLGYEATFGYIHAIKLAQQGSLMEKRVGYLAVSLFLNESHELLLLLVNTVLKDLQSTNLLEVCMALTVASQLFPPDMIPAVLPLVEEKLQHSKEIIRRKAVLALYKFYLIAPNQVQHIHDKFRKALCDRDPGVMAASLHIYLLLIKENPGGYKDLTKSFVTILKQVVGGKLAVDFNYHSVPAPWLQIQLLRILRLLGKDDQITSELMYDVLDESLRRAEINHNITYAILFECIQTVYTIHPKADLLEKAAKCNGKFILSPKNNLKYLGLKALSYVIQQDLNLVLQHQMTIIECLDHPDPIIKRETLELLYRITNAQNVAVIVQKMLDYLRQSKDEYITISLVGKVAELAEKYAPTNEWFIQTMNAVFSVGGDMIPADIPNNFLRLLAEGFDDEVEDKQLRLYAVNSYLALLEKNNIQYPQRFLQVMSWVLGEYSYLKTEAKAEDIIQSLHCLLGKSSASLETKAWIFSAITKLFRLTLNAKMLPEVMQNYGNSMDSCLRQCSFELKQLVENKEIMNTVLPLDESCNDIVVDASLSFLDGFVADALGHGAAPYKPHHQRQEERLSQEKVLNFEPYGLSFATSPQTSSVTGRQSPTGLSFNSEISCNSTETGLKDSDSLKLDGVKKVWGKEGYLRKKKESKDETVASPNSESDVTADFTSTAEKTAGLSAEEHEKKLLASSLFVGLGSNNLVSLMGKNQSTAQKFRRKSKIVEGQNSYERTMSTQKAIVPPLAQIPNLMDNVLESCSPFQESKAMLLRKTASDSAEVPTEEPAQESDKAWDPRDNLKTIRAVPSASKESISGLFAGGNVDIVQPANCNSALVAHEPTSSLPPRLPVEFAEHPHSKFELICANENIALFSCKVWKEDCLLIVLFFTNRSSIEVTNATVNFALTDELQACESTDFPFPLVESQATVKCQLCLQMMKPCARVLLTGRVTYHLETSQHIQEEFALALFLTDFIRPLKLTTEEFGHLWLSLTNDVKQNLSFTSDSPEALTVALRTLQQELKLHIVDIIGAEGIVACQLLPSTSCLLHCRFHAGILSVWLRSGCCVLPDCLLYECQKVIQKL
ncbi:AP-4 complex subunit epsilon-1 [Scyliorhinus canicula]|uniref:AP-4 complex subunit epsilon-1 n=1 Tax=Scyliorhinus canicula TaxID=7830 RepID=UPI0018F6DDEC|nr:AP-4 complex subunit epsilon-1 [Scyliorhinus canicula]